MPQEYCTLIGPLFDGDGTVAANVRVSSGNGGFNPRVVKVVKAGVAVSTRELQFWTDENGEIKSYAEDGATVLDGLRILKASDAWIQAPVSGFAVKGGVRVAIPDADEYEFRLLVPGTGGTASSASQTALNEHAAKLANPDDPGHIENVGAGLNLEDGVISLGDLDATFATDAALSAEATTRAGADTTLQTNINTEAAARASGDTAAVASANAYTDTQVASSSTADRARANHTGTQAVSTVVGLQAALDAKALATDLSALTTVVETLNDEVDALAVADIAGLQTALDAKLPLAGGTMTGALVLAGAPTLDLHPATKKYVDDGLAALVDSSPGTLDTLNELAAAIGDDPNFATTLTTLVGTKLAKASNLSDLADIPTAKLNLSLVKADVGLGNVANVDTTNASNISSGTLPDGRFPATLPALSGVNLTALNASNLGSGTVPAARMPALTGDVTTSAGAVATTIANDAVTYAKLQNVSAASKLLGRGSAAGAGDAEEITLGTGLTMTGTTLSASGGPTINATDTVIPYRSSSTALADSPLFRESANVTAQRNGTTAQTQYLYNSRTDASNYSRAFFQFNAGAFELGCENLGSDTNAAHMRIAQKYGSGNGVFIMARGADRWQFTGPGHLIPVTNLASQLGGTANYLTGGYFGKVFVDFTNTAAGTTGNQTINKGAGTVNFAAGASSLTVTSDKATANSVILCVVRTNDSTAKIKNVVPAAGSFVINLEAAATAETSVGFFIVN